MLLSIDLSNFYPELSRFSSRNITLRDGHIVSDEYNNDIQSAEEVLRSLPEETE